jgi:thiol-disulfide isomerase/thioredoxin
MFRILTAAALAAFLVAPALRADDKPKDIPNKPADPKKSRAEQLSELQQDFRKAFQGIVTEWRAAKDDEARNKALAKVDPFLERAYKLVEESPKDDVSLNTLLFTMQTKPVPPDKTIDLLAEHQINNSMLAPHLLQFAGQNTPAIQKLVKAAEKSTSKENKGAVALAKGNQKAGAADSATGEIAEKLSKEAEDLLVSAVKEFGDVKIGGQNIAKMAEKTLFTVRNLGIGKTAPEVVSKDLDGKETKLSSYKGKVVVLDIWATWCGPCRAMIPHERDMVEKLKDKPFTFISISADDEVKTLKEFLEKEKMPWVHWWEGRHEGGILNDWNVQFFPTVYVLDAKGVIRFKNVRGKQLEDAVETLVKETEVKK